MTSKPNILLVDDDLATIGLLGGMLQDVGRLRFATSGVDGLRLAQQQVPDLVLLDVDMPDLSGFEVCAAMKQISALADVPVIFLTSHDSAEHEVAGLELGASDFVAKPPRAALVSARVRLHLRMKQMADELRAAAYFDGLTGVSNRRQFNETLEREWSRCYRRGGTIALLLADIDLFKRYNDHYGHQAGDRCLTTVAQAMRHAAHRPTDLVARYGGEEFAVLLPDTTHQGACHVAEHMLQVVDALQLPHAASSVADHVTLSIGVAVMQPRADGSPGADSRFGGLSTAGASAELLASADEALYAAKRAGRCRAYCLSDGEEPVAIVLPVRKRFDVTTAS